MALPGKGKKRTTNAKTSSLSKRHKPSSAGNSTTKSAPSTKFQPKPVETLNSAPSKSAFGPERVIKEKKDRKGKGPAFIPAVEQSDSSDDSDGAMEVDEEVDTGEGNFLMSLDTKGMAVFVFSALSVGGD